MKYVKNKSGVDKIALRFDHVGKGLTAKGGALKGFAICGEDKIWKWADAEIVGEHDQHVVLRRDAREREPRSQ